MDEMKPEDLFEIGKLYGASEQKAVYLFWGGVFGSAATLVCGLVAQVVMKVKRLKNEEA